MGRMWNKFWLFVFDLLFPRRCPFCQRLLEDGEHLLCAQCQRELPWLIGEESKRKGEFFTVCVAPLRYQDAVRHSHHRYKFNGCRSYGRIYAELMAQCLNDCLPEPFDIVTWVPLSRRHLRQRGYDQSMILARDIAKILGLKAERLLDKRVNTKAQSSLDEASLRRANVMGAYQLHPGAQVAGKRILLVDDVMTTGATLSECARVLKSMGAVELSCVVLAHTPKQVNTQR